jgi:hypothetical protein
MSYVLQEVLASKRQKQPVCFARMTAIGPMTSVEPEDWARFDSEQEAMRCPAYYHALSCHEPRSEADVLPDPAGGDGE